MKKINLSIRNIRVIDTKTLKEAALELRAINAALPLSNLGMPIKSLWLDIKYELDKRQTEPLK